MDQILPSGFARLLFGLLAQDNRLNIRAVADDAATVTFAGQAFTVTVTASRPKVAVAVAVDDKPAKRGKVGE